MASHAATKPKQKAVQRFCVHCRRRVFSLAPRVPGDEHAFCSLGCFFDHEEGGDG